MVGATVELVDPMGNQLAVATSNEAGQFEIVTRASEGQYELVITNSKQLNDEQITLGRTDVQIALKVSAASASPIRSGYAVSVGQLGIPDKARQHILAAQQHFSKMEYDAALRDEDAALTLDPACSEAWSMKALVRLAMRDFQSAIEDARRSIELDRQNAAAYLALGTAHNSLRQFESAGQVLKRALEIDPDLWQAQLELAKTWYGDKKWVLALRELDLINKDFADVHLVRANVLMSLHRTPEGAQEFARFVDEAPQDSRVPEVQRILTHAQTPRE